MGGLIPSVDYRIGELEKRVAALERQKEPPFSEINYVGEIKKHDTTVRNILINVQGKVFYCPCGCNMFSKPDTTSKTYTCNNCKNLFYGD